MKFRDIKAAMLIGALGAGVSSIGHAADLGNPPEPVRAPVVTKAPSFSWTGVYLGANGGYGWGSLSAKVLGLNAPALESNPSGFNVGPQVGFNWQIAGGLVLGMEFDASWTNLSRSFSIAPVVANTFVSTVDWFGTGRLRLGYAVGQTLVYGTGGVAWAINSASFVPPIVGFERYHVGWTVGAGIEQAIDAHWSIKAEFLYADLGKRAIEVVFNAPTPIDSSIRLSTARAGLNFRF